ncbi:MAG TPA: hypothetical protein VFI34_12075 [Candidatus Limnocylindrales bacterium]|nr:hypothetical protein [Candidatus Limnocylindrales bacterium]
MVGTLLGFVLVALAGCADVPEVERPPVIAIDPGLHPVRTADEVAAIVLRAIHANEIGLGRVLSPARIIRMSVTLASRVRAIEPNAGQGQPAANRTVWVVRAFGTFTTNRGPANAQLDAAGSGYYVIDDGDGSIMGDGFP